MPKILIVDDEADHRETLAQILRERGYDVSTAPNGTEALSSVLNDKPDLLVADLLMPELDGASLIEIIRSYLRVRSLPVIVLTGLSDSPKIERVQSLGVNAVLVKGNATANEIADTIRQALHRVPS